MLNDDFDLHHKIKALNMFIQPKHLEIPEEYWDMNLWAPAILGMRTVLFSSIESNKRPRFVEAQHMPSSERQNGCHFQLLQKDIQYGAILIQISPFD